VIHALALVIVFAQSAVVAPPPPGSIRDPAFSTDGRLAVSVDGDLWVSSGAGAAATWTRVTSGAAWDREPAWATDGSLVFSSDRGGTFDIWQLRIGAEPTRVTSSPEADGEPAALADGRVIFVRGSDAAARLWIRGTDGAERRLTRGETAERNPAISPDGSRLAYVSVAEAGRRLRVRWIASDADSLAVGDRNVEHPAWSPSGDRLLFTVGGARPGVFVAPVDGRYVNLVSARHAAPAWSPDGRTILMVMLPNDPPGYNGDPNRLGDREVSDRLGVESTLWMVDAPAAPDAGLASRSVAVERPRAERNAEAFERVWARTASLYYAAPDATARRGEWARIKTRYAAAASAALTDSALADVMHRMLRERPPLREAAVGRAAVSSAHPIATEAGLEILRKGGNVVDAAVAVSFALGVVEPDASGMGGYGQMLVQMKGMEKPALYEFMARVPEEATLSNAALMQDGRYPPDGPILAIVPGTVAGMHAAWKKSGSGKVPWADLIAPAIRAAKDGYVVSDGLATTISIERDHFTKYESSRALFFRDGKPLVAGDTIRNADLAWTLQQVAARGADGFYRGEVARRMVTDLRGKGNAIKLTDLSRYYAAEREPVSGTYRGHTVFSSAPPVSGGATLVAELNLLEQWPSPKAYAEDAGTLHAMIAAWQLVPSSRNRIADPGLWPTTVEPFTNKDTARVRWQCFDPSRALSPTIFRGDTLRCSNPTKATESSPPPEDEAFQHAQGTTAFVVADADGNVVAVTQTLGTWGGNFYVSPGLGFLYNDKLTSYGTDPNAYGARLPFARHGSTLAPAIVFRGTGANKRPVLAVGAAGNAWITSAVYQTVVGVIDQGLSPQAALEQPRFLVGGRGGGGGAAPRETVVQIEDGFAPDVIRRLRAMGYGIEQISLLGELRMGYGAAVSIGDKTVAAGADPRRSGAAGAVK
jgi:gamma-glutamyltranspeptidase